MSVSVHGLEAIRRSTIISPTVGDLTEYCIRTCVDGTVTIDGTVEGSFSPSGLSQAGRNTTLSVGTTAVAIPASALTDRNSMLIRNLDATVDLYIGFDTGVTATQTVGTTSGWLVGPNETYNVDIKDDILIYGIVASGSILVQVQEFA